MDGCSGRGDKLPRETIQMPAHPPTNARNIDLFSEKEKPSGNFALRERCTKKEEKKRKKGKKRGKKEEKRKNVSFLRVYVCVKAKLTFVSFFPPLFLCTFPLGQNYFYCPNEKCGPVTT